MPINYSINYSIKHGQLNTFKAAILKTLLLKSFIFKGIL
jgi:hypothetical protein